MQLQISADLEGKLARLAAQQGKDSTALAVEAIERMVAYDEWFLGQVELGIEAAERGDMQDQVDVRRLIEKRYPA